MERLLLSSQWCSEQAFVPDSLGRWRWLKVSDQMDNERLEIIEKHTTERTVVAWCRIRLYWMWDVEIVNEEISLELGSGCWWAWGLKDKSCEKWYRQRIEDCHDWVDWSCWYAWEKFVICAAERQVDDLKLFTVWSVDVWCIVMSVGPNQNLRLGRTICTLCLTIDEQCSSQEGWKLVTWVCKL